MNDFVDNHVRFSKMVKEQFRETELARKVSGVKFTAGKTGTMRDVSQLAVLTKDLYQRGTPGRWQPQPFGPLDLKMGTCQKSLNCTTCGHNQQDCVGHFGYLDLALPVFHIGFFRLTIQTLQSICKNCSVILLPPEKRKAFLAKATRPSLTYLARKALHTSIMTVCKKTYLCPTCGFKNGMVKKAVGAPLKIVHAKGITDTSKFDLAFQDNKELHSLVTKGKLELLNPMRVMRIFENIRDEDLCLLMIGGGEMSHPVDLLLTRMPVPPVCIRPSVVSDIKAGSTEDDITMKISEIQFLNEVIRKRMADGALMHMISTEWDYLQIQCALYINSEMSGVPSDMQQKKFTRSFAQRLKGKQGRFRGNLSGKRVDFSGRTVISPDPNLRIYEVGVPVLVAKILTYPEVVTKANIERMRQLVINGTDLHPGANFIQERSSGEKKFLKYGNRKLLAEKLRFGDTIERHLQDGDIVLYNRQPSLHKVSIMAHRARVMPYRTFRFNECACTPYNADFDGDEMNLHLPQTEEARAEAMLLMGVKSNTITPRSGEPLVAAIQDFITGTYLLTHKDRFLPQSTVMRIMAAAIESTERCTLPHPAILKPVPLWTGKQLIEVLIRGVSSDSNIKLNMSVPNKSYKKGGQSELDPTDNYVVIRNSQLLAGCLDKQLIGSGSKINIFYTLLRDYNEDACVDAMYRVARMAPVFLTNYGFSIGIGDVRPGTSLLKDKKDLVDNGYSKCQFMIDELKAGRLVSQPGCNPEQTLEAQILKELSMIRDHAGSACVKNLNKHNSPLTMAVCGSKGSFINISQMIACVGQQAISGKRPPDGFENRSLPHFERFEKTPPAKGFVRNSFYSGLTPTEFFFHTMAGREGLVDTAVKTAETGYMQRRLVKCLEDLCVQYDGTVRTSSNDLVQFIFGDDALDPASMEAKDGSVLDLPHLIAHIRAIHNPRDRQSEWLEPDDLKLLVEETIEDQKAKKCAAKFCDQLKEFVIKYIDDTAKYWNMPVVCQTHVDKRGTKSQSCIPCQRLAAAQRLLKETHCLTVRQCVEFIELCAARYKRAVTEPGTAVGAIAATSIGEPSTQMTLKTFHFAGVASMNITQGVPRIKEIINAVKNISTPIITAALPADTMLQCQSEEEARRVKMRIEATTLGEITEYVKDVYLPDDCFVLVKIAVKRVQLLRLEVSMGSLVDRILRHKFLVPIKAPQIRLIGKSIILVRPMASAKMSLYHAIQYIKLALPKVIVKGLPSVSRCVIHADEKSGQTYKLLVEGTDFQAVLATYGVEPSKTKFNNALEVAKVLGIEAARKIIISEILDTMANHGIGLDIRHVMLLADLMTYKGELLGITRNGLAKMKDSVLMLASFERTCDHLFEAGFYGQQDNVSGVSECIIMGLPMVLGTGLFKLLQRAECPKLVRRQPVLHTQPVFNSFP